MVVPTLVVLEPTSDLVGFPLTFIVEHVSEHSESAEHAGVTRQTVSNYLDLLLEADVVEEVPNTSPRRYRVAKSEVIEELFELNSALNVAGE